MNTLRTAQTTGTGRRLSVLGFVVLVVVYLVLIQGLGFLLTRGLDAKYAAPTSIDELWRSMTLPIGLSVVLVVAVVSYLRWWRPVWTDDRPVRSWLIAVPVVMVVSILLVTNYGGLASKGGAFTLLLLLSCLFVGFGEELMFRGLGVTVFRTQGFSEGKVALWVTLIFGLAHASNLFTEGPGAFAQVLATIIAGYFFYLIRRRTGGILVPALVHGAWDFSLVSNFVVEGETRLLPLVAVLTMVVLAVVVLVGRRKIEPAPAAV
jgi:membrane protease YdiL (CAAX protease family)